ncbi:hypothetical protein [Undibacterium fentianense]|uniref:Uncharacterized protein n=1 Tax=Undibacterium fentianense TaxID=2828728 RepID=A0A941E120_9BURK|nr:hypothetical protein [Undibacterium fentianense]MBR7800405.1 hypothetical protein [Undibacterium fentianense]
MMANLFFTAWSFWMILAVSLFGVASCVFGWIYWRRAQKLNSVLVVLAGLALCISALPLSYLREPDAEVLIDSRQALPNLANLHAQLLHAKSVRLEGDGLDVSAWRDLPVRRLNWDQRTWSKGESLSLEFPQQIAFGRVFELQVERAQARGEWRVQLLAENRQILSEHVGNGSRIRIQWLPPLIERMVLHARIIDEKGQLIDEGPIPLEVLPMPELQVQGRFAAPSFDTQALNQLLAQSQAVMDWQTQIGKALIRKELARTAMRADLLIQDAAYFEQASDSERRELLKQVESGRSLLILGANAQQAGIWKSSLGLPLRQQASASEEQEWKTPQGIALHSVQWMPSVPTDVRSSPWQFDPTQVWMVSRTWGQGKIVWLAAAGWHQSLIAQAQELKLWWQSVLDLTAVKRTQEWEWNGGSAIQAMALAGQSFQICGRGQNATSIRVSTTQSATESVQLELRPHASKAEAECAAFWPPSSGWYTWQPLPKKDVVDPAANSQGGAIYVFAQKDWPSWQRQLKRQAIAIYAQKIPEAAISSSHQLVHWPWILFSMLCLLWLWKREQT